MNQDFKSDHSGKAVQTYVTRPQGDAARQVDNMRAATLRSSGMNTNQILGTSRAVQESINETFGKTEHDAQVEADRKSYTLKDNVLSISSKIKDTSGQT